MELKPFIVVSKLGHYHLGVDTIQEAIFAATGDYSLLEGIGYPTLLGDFVEQELDITVYNPIYEEPEDLKETLEFVYWNHLQVFNVTTNGTEDFSSAIKYHIKQVYYDYFYEDIGAELKV
ncbi:hypothetical protein P47N_0098 [Bacteriophage T5-like saus47N]|uniref:Uncharacterized protein n=6 Tax=Tequintavirus chee24 TaxID=2733981 RepID=A0A2K8HL86_9CAUD|nr:hypothetical protein HOS38_gp119 [Escherichia phage chee24]ASU01705.1 hypothetical protein P27_0100 [Bacteriophage T5-like pork27]ASU01857.1 hypothetical protein P29_0099 [Bacteriophage T5-like pork29]ASU02008.1 hypothetical protein P47N_0098 [Bacteriophage T5-like saus47N]ASU02160.1 hypothetical protein P111K_0099 [Bacteriophage T5-like saus111K]ASU02311.1 hypothetical protein P124_0099 [Bacteriophage T5-like poul124]